MSSRGERMERIVSKSNEKVKHAFQLLSSSKRRASGEFLLEGARLCADAAVSGVEIERAFFSSDSLVKYGEYIKKITAVCPECHEITAEISGKLSDTENPQGVFCVCKMRKSEESFLKVPGRYLMLENVQDPSNLGAIFRTAEALGIDALILSGGCDIYNPKALRAAMGSSLRMSVIYANDAVSFIESNKSGEAVFFACVPSSDALDITAAISRDFPAIVCVLGNEGAGLTPEVTAACDNTVTIPMKGRAESLNVSVAAAIAAWELVK